MSAGRLFGVGVGPGDPELVTVKARRIVANADVVAYPVARRGRGVARAVVAPSGDRLLVRRGEREDAVATAGEALEVLT